MSELKLKRKLKIIIQFSGGKDSLATLLWVINESGFKKESMGVVFCDTVWEHDITYEHIKEVIEKTGIKSTTLKSKKYVNKLPKF